jgi:WD40 repeat protein
VVTPDGKTLITASTAAILFWDLASGKPSANIRTVGVTSLSISSDGAILLSSSGGVYRLPDRAPFVSGCSFDDHVLVDSNPTFRALSPDGKTIATALSNGGIILQPVDACKGHRSRIEGRVFSDARVVDDPFPDEGSRLVFSPDGTRIAGVTGAAVTVWDVARGRSLVTFGAQIGDFRSLAFLPHGRRILTANGDATARLFDARSGTLLGTLKGHRNALTDARFSPDGRRIVTSSLDLTARLWDVATGRELQRYAGHTSAVLAVAFSPDGRSVVTASADGTARRWLTEPPLEPNTYRTGATDVSALAFSGDSRLLASGTGDRIQVRDLEDHRLLLDVVHQRNAHVALSPDGHSLLIASDAGSSLWDVQTTHELRSFGTQSQGPRCDVAAYLDTHSRERVVLLGAAAFLPRGDQVLANSPDCGLGLWDLASGRNLRTFVDGTPLATLSADGSTVAYEGWADCPDAFVVDLRTGRTRARSGAGCLIDLALAPDGTRVVLTDQLSFEVHVVDVATGRRIELRGHTAFVKEVRVSADGRFVLTAAGGADGTARLWDMATGELVRLFPGHADLPVAGVAISPDGKSVAIGGSDGTVMVAPLRLEDLEAAVCSRVLRDLTADERKLYGVEGTAATCP